MTEQRAADVSSRREGHSGLWWEIHPERRHGLTVCLREGLISQQADVMAVVVWAKRRYVHMREYVHLAVRKLIGNRWPAVVLYVPLLFAFDQSYIGKPGRNLFYGGHAVAQHGCLCCSGSALYEYIMRLMYAKFHTVHHTLNINGILHRLWQTCCFLVRKQSSWSPSSWVSSLLHVLNFMLFNCTLLLHCLLLEFKIHAQVRGQIPLMWVIFLASEVGSDCNRCGFFKCRVA